MGFLLLLLCGCLSGRVLPPPGEITYPSPQAALQAISTLPPTLTLSASARIRTQHQGQPVSLRAALLIGKPASLRLESIPLMGPPDFFLSIAHDELRVFLPQEGGGRFYLGPATPENLSRFFPLALPPPAIVSLLMGEADDLTQLQEPGALLRGEQENHLYRIDEYRRGQRLRSLWVDPARDLLVRLQRFDPQGEPLSTVAFGDHLLGAAGPIPREISLSHHALPDLSIRYGDLEPVLPGPNVEFALPIPEGVAPLRLD